MLIPIVKTKNNIYALGLHADRELWYNIDGKFKFKYLIAINIVESVESYDLGYTFSGVELIVLFFTIELCKSKKVTDD